MNAVHLTAIGVSKPAGGKQMRYLLTWTCVIALALNGVGTRGSEHPPKESGGDAKQAEQIAGLIRQLADPAFRVREAASKELLKLGEVVRPALRAAAMTNKDPEAQRRIALLLAELNQRRANRLKTLSAKAELHVVGVHGAPSGRNGEVAIKVTNTDRPVILVLTAYWPVIWKVEEAKGAQLVKVIVGGYEAQKVEGADVPVEFHAHKPSLPGEKSLGYFHAYQKLNTESHNLNTKNEQYEEMAAQLKRLTGKEIASFQGQYDYDGRPFMVPARVTLAPTPKDAEVHVVGLYEAGFVCRSLQRDIDWVALCDALAEQRKGIGLTPGKRFLEILAVTDPTKRDLIQDSARVRKAMRVGDAKVLTDLVVVFNHVLASKDLHDERYFRGLTLPESAQVLLKRREALSRAEIQHLNRLLLQVSFPQAVRKFDATGMEETAEVRIPRTEHPIVLVLTAYESVRWVVRPDKGAKLHQIIVGGYEEQKVDGVDVPIHYRTHRYGDRVDGESSHFRAWERDDDYYPKMAKELRRLTGKDITGFEGARWYPGTPFVIRSKK